MADPVSWGAAITAWEAMAAEAAAVAAAEAAATTAAATTAAATTAGAVGAGVTPMIATGAEIGAGITPMGGTIAAAFGPEAGGTALGQQMLASAAPTQVLGGATGMAGMTAPQAIPVTAWDAAMGQLGALPETISNGYNNLPTVGQKMVDSTVMSTLMPQQQAQRGSSSVRMPGSGGGQAAAANPPFDYGAPNQQLQGAAGKLNISEEDLKRILMSLRGF